MRNFIPLSLGQHPLLQHSFHVVNLFENNKVQQRETFRVSGYPKLATRGTAKNRFRQRSFFANGMISRPVVQQAMGLTYARKGAVSRQIQKLPGDHGSSGTNGANVSNTWTSSQQRLGPKGIHRWHDLIHCAENACSRYTTGRRAGCTSRKFMGCVVSAPWA